MRSAEPVATHEASGEKATASTGAVWPSREAIWAPVSTRQTAADWSEEPVASRVPSRDRATASTAPSWPRTDWSATARATSQTVAEPSLAPAASSPAPAATASA